MASPWGDSPWGGSSFPAPPRRTPPRRQRRRKKEDRGILGFIGNLAGDVKDAVVGLPKGLLETGEAIGGDVFDAVTGDADFERSREVGGQILGATWQTWSPLFHGNVGKFASQLYDHPLAPLLDVATVFTLGAGGTVKGAQALSKAGVTSSAVTKTAALGRPKAITLRDPVPGREGRAHDIDRDRHDLSLHLSERPGRRLVQEFRLRTERHMPQWYVTKKNTARYEREWAKTEARELSAKNRYEDIALATIAQIKAGKALADPKTRTAAYTAMLSSMHANLAYHAPVRRVASEAAAKLPKDGRYRYVKNLSDGDFEKMLAKSEPENVLKQFGSRVTTRKLADAAVDENGNVALISKMDARNQGWEAANSSAFVKRLWHDPTMLWKSIMVGWTPRTITNNAVGNWALYAARQGGHHSLMGIYDAIRITKGERAARKMLGKPDGFANWQAHWSNKHFGDELGNTFGAEAFADEPGRISGGKLKRRAKSGLYPIVHATSDRPVRVAALAAYLREAPEVKAALRRLQAGSVKGRGRRRSDIRFTETTDYAAFNAAIRKNPRQEFLTAHTPDELAGSRVFISDDGKAGFVISPDGDLQNVFRNPGGKRGAGRAAVAEAIERGAITLDAYDGFLPDLYKEMGFREVGRMKFVDEFAPDGWDFEKYGRPDVVFMAVGAQSRRGRYFTDWDEAKAVSREAAEIGGGRASLLDRAIEEALDGNRALRDRAANHVRTIAGDYATMRPWERRVRDLVPFYLWDRHIVKTTANLALDTPGRVALMQRVSQMGIEETEDFLGKIPEFLRGAIPFGEKKGGRASVLLTHSLNPFATVGELSEAAQAFSVGRTPRGGATLLSQVNPFLTAAMEQASGRDILTGGQVESKGGILSSVLYQTAMELPPAQLAKAIKDDTSRGGDRPFLYEKGSAKTVGLSLLGVPTRNVSLDRAAELYRKEHGITKGRRRRRREQEFRFLSPELRKTPAAF